MPIFENQYAPISDGHLPVQLPAVEQAGDDPSGHYASLPQPIAVFNGLDGIIYTYSTITSPLGVKSMFSGMVTYLPANTSYAPVLSDFTVNSEITTTNQGGVLLELFPIVGQALKTLPDTPDGGSPLDGVFIPAYILIEGVDAATFRSDMQALMPDVVDAILDLSWMETEGNAPGTREEKENKFLDRLMLGEKQLAVGGGDDIGTTVLNADNNPEFTLKMYSSEVETGSVAYVFYASRVDPLLFIQRFPSFIDPTDTANSYFSKWHNHPLITAIADFSANVLRAYIKFEVWNPDSLTGALLEYAPVDSGLTVKMMDHDTFFMNPDDPLASTTTNENGVAFFQIDIPEDGWLNGSPPDLYFKILAPTASMASDLPPLPAEWSTKANSGTNYWLSTSGEKGYYENFSGTQLGSPANPLVFRIGLDFHVKFQYYDQSTPNAIFDGTRVDFHDTLPTSSSVGDLYPPPKYSAFMNSGIVHGQIFDIEPNSDIYWYVPYEMQDSTTGLDVQVVEIAEITGQNDFGLSTLKDEVQIKMNSFGITSIEDFNSYPKTSVGSSHNPITFSTPISNQSQMRAAFYILKVARELSIFYEKLTQGDYHKVVNKYRFSTYLSLPVTSGYTAHAIPVDVVQMTDISSNWKRDTIIHESSHHVYWHAVDYSSLDILGEALGGQLKLKHAGSLMYNAEMALIEGFPEAMEIIFIPSAYYKLYSFSEGDFIWVDVVDWVHGINLGPSSTDPINRGELIEGMVANAISDVFWKVIVDPHHTGTAHGNEIKESLDGNILGTPSNTWLNNTAIQDAFVNLIWTPLQSLISSPDDPNSTTYFSNMLSSDPSLEHEIRGILNTYNIAVIRPVATSLTPTSGSVVQGTRITITGENFIKDESNQLGRTAELIVMFGTGSNAMPGQNIYVLDKNTLEVDIPTFSTTGQVQVTVVLKLTGYDASSNLYVDRGIKGALVSYTLSSFAVIPPLTFTFI